MTEATAAVAADKPETTAAPALQAGVSDSKGPAKPDTILDAALAGADKEAAVPATWPEDWRERYAGKDAEDLKSLKRYTAPENVWKSYKALRQKVETEYKRVTPFPAEGSDEDKAAWRTEQGIPDAPDKYDTTIGDGIVWGEADKPLLENYTKYAHDNHLAPDLVKANLRWYHQMQQQMVDAREQQDAGHRAQSEDALRADWGPDYRVNMNVVSNYLKTLPTTLNEMLMDARTSDGRRLINDAEMLKHLAGTARELNPAAALLPASASGGKDIPGRLAEIEGLMRDRRSDYYRGPNAEKIQTEYRDLLVAQTKIATRAA